MDLFICQTRIWSHWNLAKMGETPPTQPKAVMTLIFLLFFQKGENLTFCDPGRTRMHSLYLEPTWLQEPVFEWFSNQILNQFRLLSDWFWADICSLQEPLFIIFRSILDHFRLMSDRFWIDIYSILTWIGLMFTRCWDRFSSDLNKSILTLIATRIDKWAHWHLHVCNISK